MKRLQIGQTTQLSHNGSQKAISFVELRLHIEQLFILRKCLFRLIITANTDFCWKGSIFFQDIFFYTFFDLSIRKFRNNLTYLQEVLIFSSKNRCALS